MVVCCWNRGDGAYLAAEEGIDVAQGSGAITIGGNRGSVKVVDCDVGQL